jgi:hypothetical protein
MDDTQETIGLTALLDEVSRDLEELRRKHPGDFSLKNLDLWWELERERLLTRHHPSSILRRHRRLQSLKRVLAWFTAGSLAMIVGQTAVRLLLG